MKRLIKIFISIFLLDIIVATIILLWIKPDPSVAVLEILIIPILFVLNIIAGIFLITKRKKPEAYLLFLNTFISALIFKIALYYWFKYDRHLNYNEYIFTNEEVKYKILLQKKDSLFIIYDITNQRNGSTTSIMMGDYKVKNDSIFLYDIQQSVNCFIYHERLVGFKGSNEPIPLMKN